MKQLSQILEGKTEIYTKRTKEQKLKNAPLDPKNVVTIGGKTEVETSPTISGGQPDSQQTLKPLAMPADAIKGLIDHYSQLNQEKRKGFTDYLTQVFNDSAWRKPGAGVEPGTSEKNQKRLHREEAEAEAFLSEQLEEIGFSLEAQDKAKDLFFTAVVRRVNEELAIQQDEPHPFRQKLMELLANYSPHPFQDVSEMERLALQVEDLEEKLTEINLHKRELQQEIYLHEEQLFLDQAVETERRSPRKSNLDAMLEPDEANANAYYNQTEKHISPQMKRYLNEEGSVWGIPRGMGSNGE